MSDTHQWITISEIARVLGVTARHSTIAEPLSLINGQILNGASNGRVEINGTSVPWEIKGRSILVPSSSITAFQAQFASKPRPEPGFLNRQQVAAALETVPTNKVIGLAFEEMRRQYSEGHQRGRLELDGAQVEWSIFYSEKNLRLPFLHSDALVPLHRMISRRPRIAKGDEITMGRLMEALSVTRLNPLMKSLISQVDTAIAEGQTGGTVSLHDVSLDWALVQPVRGGAGKYQGLAPHFHLSAVGALASVLGKNPDAISYDGDHSQTAQNKQVDGGEPPVELQLRVLGDGKIPNTVRAKAVEAEDGSMFFVLEGVSHLLDKAGNVLRLFYTEDEPVWHRSTVLQALIAKPIDDETKSSADDGSFVTRWDVARHFGVTPHHSTVRGTFAEIDSRIKTGAKRGTVEIAGTVYLWEVRKMTRGGSPAPTLPHSSIASFAVLHSANRPTTDGFLTRRELAERLGIDQRNGLLSRLWSIMRGLSEVGADGGTLSVKGRHIDWKYLSSKTNNRFPYVSEQSVKALSGVAGPTSDVRIEIVPSQIEHLLRAEPPHGQPLNDGELPNQDLVRVEDESGGTSLAWGLFTKSGKLAFAYNGQIHVVTEDQRPLKLTSTGWKQNDAIVVETGSAPRSRGSAIRP